MRFSHRGLSRSMAPIWLLMSVVVCAVALQGAYAEATKRKGGGNRGNLAKGAASPTAEWWREIDTGPFISDTILSRRDGEVAALKGIAIKLGAEREVSVVFDTELLAWRAGFDGTVALEGTAWSGSHGGNSHYPSGDGIFFFQ